MPQTIHQESISAREPVATQGELEALLTSAGLVPLAHIGWIKITGTDRVRWLNGMVTNSIGDLGESHGCYNFILNAQGRIQGDGYAFAEPDHLLLETGLSQIPTLLALLDRFIIMDDVELTNITSSKHGLMIAGPHAPAVLSSLGLLPSPATAPSLARVTWQGAPVSVIHGYSPLVPRFELWSDEPTISALTSELAARNATLCTPAALDLLRIAEGTPLFGTDIRDRDLPQETGATRALHFSKGCYLGQEIVERIRSRGNVHRTFGGFHLLGANASTGLALTVDEKPVGELTSVAALHHPDTGDLTQIALGYIRREALAQGKPIHYEGGTATSATLPFQIAEIL